MVIFLLIAELGFRLVRYIVVGGPLAEHSETRDDAQLGWTLNPYRKTIRKRNACDEPVVRDPPRSPYIGKEPRYREATRMLFLGDSFTHAHEVSSGAAYYDVLEQSLPQRFAVYAAGVGGYGTAQEYLLLQKIFNEIEPAIVVWQLTNNDPFENVYVGKDLSTVQRPRPYYDLGTGQFFLADPGVWLFEHSGFAKYVLGKLILLERSHPIGVVSRIHSLFGHRRDAAQVEAEGLQVMQRIVTRAVQQYRATRFIGFSADPDYDVQYEKIFRAAGADYFPGIAGQLQASGSRFNCLPLDGHWNHLGNRLAGQILSARLSAYAVERPN
jgi:hypothetical protein